MKEIMSLATFVLSVLCLVTFVTTVRPTAISVVQGANDYCRRDSSDMRGCDSHVFAAVSGAARQPWQFGAAAFDASLMNAR
jgi:hypothetical protein